MTHGEIWLSPLCHETQEPIFITKNGYGDLVVMSMETYEDLLASTEIDNAITESEAQISSGEELLDAKEVLGAARRKYFG